METWNRRHPAMGIALVNLLVLLGCDSSVPLSTAGMATTETCGNGVVEPGEVCDDGAENRDGWALNAHCNATCSGLAPYCGDGLLSTVHEACDTSVETAVCNSDCTPAVCGDGKLNAAAGEECDDGNADNNDSCYACSMAMCGDGDVWTGHEVCDDGADNGTVSTTHAFCAADCSGTQLCGNGEIEGSETCDNGHANSDDWAMGDSCNATCSGAAPYCGDGVTDVSEEVCDDGNEVIGDMCSWGCSYGVREIEKLLASDGAERAGAGSSISVDGDTLVMGAPNWSGVGPGAAYIFERNHGGPDHWGEVVKLLASDGTTNDRFGAAVAVDGDTVVVGAPIGLNRQEPGAAYIFERNHGGPDHWGEVTKLVGSAPRSQDESGLSVAIDGDTVIVGTSYNGAYVFERDAGGADNWGEVALLRSPDGDVYSRNDFGERVAISGDTVLVANPYNLDHRGSAYVFGRDQGGVDNWGLLKKLVASDGIERDFLGSGVALDGSTAVLGAPRDAASGATGSAYVFERDAGGAENWGQVAKLLPSSGAVEDVFGRAVGISETTIVVGASFDADDTGAVYVFERDAGGVGGWGRTAKVLPADAVPDRLFGCSVGISGQTIGAGSFWDDENAHLAGSAYVFEVLQ